MELFKTNYEVIAENMAGIYYILKNSYISEKLSKKQLLFATAYLDVFYYIQTDQINEKQLKQAVLLGRMGKLRLGIFSKDYELYWGYSDDDLFERSLLGLVMQVESLIFNIESSISENAIIESVIAKKKKIEKSMNKIFTKGNESKVIQKMFRFHGGALQNVEFIEKIQNISFEDTFK